jgi:hypothetical protein
VGVELADGEVLQVRAILHYDTIRHVNRCCMLFLSLCFFELLARWHVARCVWLGEEERFDVRLTKTSLRLQADAVVIGAGVVPNTKMLKNVTLSKDGSVIVDPLLK